MLFCAAFLLAMSNGSPATVSADNADRNSAIGLTPHGGWTYPRGALAMPMAEDVPAIAPSMLAPDPLAPRPDAPIFRLNEATHTALPTNGDVPETAPTAPVTDAPTAGGARYYSIHRQAGRQPDTTVLPAPVYLDALPVQLDNLPAGEDLATPPAPPEVYRDTQGRLRPVPLSDDLSE